MLWRLRSLAHLTHRPVFIQPHDADTLHQCNGETFSLVGMYVWVNMTYVVMVEINNLFGPSNVCHIVMIRDISLRILIRI